MERVYFQQDFLNQTTLHPVGLLIFGVLSIVLLTVPRKWVILPIAIIACFVSTAQRVVLFGLDLDFLRLIVALGWGRLIIKNEMRRIDWKLIDKIFLIWQISGVIIPVIGSGRFDAIVTLVGRALYALGVYFLVRQVVRGDDDVWRLGGIFIMLCIPAVVFFAVESRTARNCFAIFGGVSEITVMREGRLRCQGPFEHPIIAGCFWASLIPIVAVWWWRGRKYRKWAIISTFSMCAIVVASASSTPVLAVIAGFVAACMYPFRQYMKVLRWGILFILIGLHVVMNGPVWHLICRFSVVSGSTAYFRYRLVDGWIRHFSDWWLVGLGNRSTEYWGRGLHDVTNHYVVESIGGGILKLGLFIALISLTFKAIGQLMLSTSSRSVKSYLFWALGTSLFIHVTNFWGVAYFGWKMTFVFCTLLAVITSLLEENECKKILCQDFVRHGVRSVLPQKSVC